MSLLQLRRVAARRVLSRASSSLSNRAVETDSCGIPRRPTWSVNELLSSYPVPSLAPHTLKHLHDLSALVPPEENTPEYKKLKTGLEELIRLVEAVKIVDTEGVPAFGREDAGRPAEADAADVTAHEGGRSLLNHSARIHNGFYIVDADKPQ
ncbi:hypothetical protein B0H16DRAFT_1498746 [Mycena metata]|uniref:Glutamyl-tRNA(Gln) amidotransferase subunit F, mitochondrial n=1 Tax=Mycena metata TaxID=1033252 RepID=A0AAD7KAE0_9AGAR|nr:hypothetical protein B0H16DRAFT_1498746 [Mycena metata]